MYNKDKAKWCFAVTRGKRVAIFQVNLKLVREEARAKLSNKDNKFHGLNHLCKGGAVNNVRH